MIIENGLETTELQNNTVIGKKLKLNNSTINFKGTGNILYAEPNVTLRDSEITFRGDNALVYLSSNGRHPYKLKLDMWRQTCAAFGRASYFNGVFTAIMSERCNLIVGNEFWCSFGIWLRTADPHLIYDASTGERTNMSKSVIIGDHVWVGQNAMILKGCTIGSGSIISAGCVLAGKRVESNSVYAGNPGRKIKSNVFYLVDSVHNYTEEQSVLSMKAEPGDYVFAEDGKQIDTGKLDEKLRKADTAEQKLEIVKKSFIKKKAKNRLYVAPEKPAKRGILGFFK